MPTEDVSTVLARQVRHWRDRRKLSAQALATRLQGIGSDLTRRSISKIENGDRGVSVDEWLQLAHALAVPPALLFLDLEAGTPVKIGEGVELYPWLAWQWVIGDEPPVLSDRTITRVEEWSQARTAIGLYRQDQEASGRVDDARTGLRRAEFADDESEVRQAKARLADALKVLAGVMDEMVDNGMTPPPKAAAWVELIRSLGLSRYPDTLSPYPNTLSPATAPPSQSQSNS